MKVLVTGGAGYIGSHTCLALLELGYDVVAVDNFCNSSPESLKRVEELTGKQVPLYGIDVRDESALDKVFREHDIGCAIHFAGLKAVGESVEKPLSYYENNLLSTMTLLKVMGRNGVKKKTVCLGYVLGEVVIDKGIHDSLSCVNEELAERIVFIHILESDKGCYKLCDACRIAAVIYFVFEKIFPCFITK